MAILTSLPPLRTLFFDDLKIGMTERLKKTSRVRRRRLCEAHRGPQSDPSVGAFCRPHAVWPAHRARPLHREPDLGSTRHAAAGAGRDLHCANAQFSRAGTDRRHGDAHRHRGRADAGQIMGATDLRVQGRPRVGARRRSFGESAVRVKRQTAVAATLAGIPDGAKPIRGKPRFVKAAPGGDWGTDNHSAASTLFFFPVDPLRRASTGARNCPV